MQERQDEGVSDTDKRQATVAVNVCYNYNMIRHCAKAVQSLEKWRHEEKVMKLKFTNHWIVGFLDRGNFKRRKITTGEKNRPTVEEVNRILELGHALYRTYLHSPKTTWNFDETAFTWAVGPTHMFIPVNQVCTIISHHQAFC